MGAAVVRRDLPPEVGRVQLWVGVGGVPIPAPPRREHHVATVDRASAKGKKEVVHMHKGMYPLTHDVN